MKIYRREVRPNVGETTQKKLGVLVGRGKTVAPGDGDPVRPRLNGVW